jgi:hypothetical protein
VIILLVLFVGMLCIFHTSTICSISSYFSRNLLYLEDNFNGGISEVLFGRSVKIRMKHVSGPAFL